MKILIIKLKSFVHSSPLLCVCAGVCMSVSVCVIVCVIVCVYIYIYIYIYMCVCVCMCVHVCIHACVYACVCSRAIKVIKSRYIYHEDIWCSGGRFMPIIFLLFRNTATVWQPKLLQRQVVSVIRLEDFHRYSNGTTNLYLNMCTVDLVELQ